MSVVKRFFDRHGLIIGGYLIFAVTFWILILIILPQLNMLDFSFRFNLPPAKMGGPEDVYTASNYTFLLGRYNQGGVWVWNTTDLSVFHRTILAAVFVTLFDLVLCYPIAYFLAQVARGGFARLLVLSLVVPFWVNEILRAFAFRILFGDAGIINAMLKTLGLVDESVNFIREDIALYAGLGYAYILLMIFPIYNAIEGLDKSQIEAARDLGASRWRIHQRVVIPFARPGIVAGCAMVFMLSAGALATPQILGGPSSLWFTQLIYQWFDTGGNWPRGAAYAVILLVACLVFVLAIMRLFKVRLGEVGR